MSGRTVVQGLIPPLIELTRENNDRLILFVDHRDVDAVSDTLARAHHVAVVPLFYPTRRIGISWFLGRSADRHHVDVLLTHGFVPARSRAACVNYVFDILFESHPEFFTWIERLYFRGMRPSCRRADRVLALSNATREALIRYDYAQGDKIDVVYPGYSAPMSAETRRAATPVPLPYFLYVGRLTSRKNLSVLLRACSRVLCETNTHLAIVGRRDRTLPARELMPPKTIRDRVHFLGHLGEDLLPEVYRSALALVYIPLAEGFGLPIIEAMSYGLPVVASWVPGVAEALGPAGLSVDPTSETQVADAMLQIACDPKLRDALRDRARQWAATFSWRQAAERVIKVCNRAYETRRLRATDPTSLKL